MDFKEKIYLMGILNITEDSFFDSSRYFEKNKAIERALEIVEEGADILDIGGESTKFGAKKVSNQGEMDRVLDVIAEVKKNTNVKISIDTYKSDVALEALKSGADIVNDISGGLFDEHMFDVCKEFNSYICITHNRTSNINKFFNVSSDVFKELKLQCDKAMSFGIDKNKIIVDVGLGFSKYGYNNILLLRDIEKFKDLGFPILVGASRKKFLSLLDCRDPMYNIESTISITSYLGTKGVNILRVHDIKENRKIIDCLNSILYGGDLNK